ncbi:MAG: Lrp/AsnC ligand binding domain-containing protein [Candidatus Delongbacteria bacterium]|nr:Lrp/AsnC ligand binding domain-containing protein [Candidatus Delongbacteria bacterium]MCG2759717.1 Lrp/AsnC ligand binding domain-containing protein [Candidatus Delongbacteria bacterium]
MTGAYLLINTQSGKDMDALAKLKKIKGVSQAHICTGLHDIICYIEEKDLKTMGHIILDKVRKIDGVTKTVTCISVS